jgi:putative transposase
MRHAGAARWAWNWALARRIEEYEATGRSSTAYDQSNQFTVLKQTAEYIWCQDISCHVFRESFANLDKAYKSFFRRVKRGDKFPGFPRFKSKKYAMPSFRLCSHIHVFDLAIQLPRIGVVRLSRRGYIPTKGIKILSATCSMVADRWFVSVNCEINVPEPTPGTGEPIGIDLGVKSMAVVSDGRVFENPRALMRTLPKLAKLQRRLSRKQQGSKNREKARKRVAKLHYRIANVRKDATHKATSSIVKAKTKPSAIVLEDLNVAGMVKNHKLARAISDASMSEFRRQIEYKAKWNGVAVVIASRFFPSSKKCSECGRINVALTLSDREWVCECGVAHDRDLNAAINLVRSGRPEPATKVANVCGENIRPSDGKSLGSRNHTPNDRVSYGVHSGGRHPTVNSIGKAW